MEIVNEHRWEGYERVGRRVCAVCSCGWRSDLGPSPGLAGAAMDAHLAGVPGGVRC